LTYVARLDPIWVNFSISEDELLKYREQRKTGLLRFPEQDAFVVDIVLADGSVYAESGRIFFRDWETGGRRPMKRMVRRLMWFFRETGRSRKPNS